MHIFSICLIQESFVSLQGLLFSCKYKVLLQPVSKKSHPPSERTSFFTPSCASIQAKSPKPITCPGEKGDTTVTQMVLFMDFCTRGRFSRFYLLLSI